MQNFALTIDKFLAHAGKWFGARELVWADGGALQARFTYAQLHERANRLSGALATLGFGPGDRLGTLIVTYRGEAILKRFDPLTLAMVTATVGGAFVFCYLVFTAALRF